MHQRHILVVERQAEAESLAASLRSAGHAVLPESDAALAAAALRAASTPGGTRVDAVLVDLSLPGIDVPALAAALAPIAAGPESLADAERRHIVRTLALTLGNRRQAAGILGVARSTLLNKIRRYRIT